MALAPKGPRGMTVAGGRWRGRNPFTYVSPKFRVVVTLTIDAYELTVAVVKCSARTIARGYGKCKEWKEGDSIDKAKRQ